MKSNVEFQPRIAFRWSDRMEGSIASRKELLGHWLGLLERAAMEAELGGVEPVPLIESLRPRQIAELIDRATRLDPDYVPARFELWYQVECPPRLKADAVAARLREMDDIKTAYVLRPGPPPAVNAADDPRFANQGYLKAAPNGIDAEYAWGFPGGDGAGLTWVDLEQGWNLNHEDLSAAGISLISGVNNAWFSHGTSVLGEVAMVDNTTGGVGGAPAATARVISQWRSATSYNTADAILDAVANMAFGDVLLLEAQEYDPVGGQYYWPVEVVDANYDAIRLATALGIVVVEAGCNGGYDLDPYTSLTGDRIFDRTAPGFRDSGAIMVGAASASVPHARLGFSNHGNRIDCYGWGGSIDTTATDGAGTDNTAYTTGFGGTSGASPMVVAATLIVQAIAEQSLGYRFGPHELRALLVTDGTPSNDPPVDRIGVMPDLRALIENSLINLAPDIYLRDKVGDTGDPTSGVVSQSPDIILRQAAVADPAMAFGDGSGTENDPALSDEAAAGIDHFLYVRLLNRGGSSAANVSVAFFWSPPSTLVSPAIWNPIGTAMLASVPADNLLHVSEAVIWPAGAMPGPGHYCFVAVAGSIEDPAPGPASFADFDQFLAYIRNNNNIAWRNFNVVPGPPSAGDPPGFHSGEFQIVGAFDTIRRFEFETIAHLPRGAKVFIEVPAWLSGMLRGMPPASGLKLKPSRNQVRIAVNPHGTRRFGPVALQKDSMAPCRLLVFLPREASKGAHEVAVRQLFEGQEVGRVTWRFEPSGNQPQGARTPAMQVRERQKGQRTRIR